MFQGARISVVVPAFNESRLITGTLSSIPEFVDHIIAVDDKSLDPTLALVQGHPDQKRIIALSHSHNRGVGAAIATGYKHAVHALNTDICAVMAGDGQMHPDDLPALLMPIIQGTADYTKGNRAAHPDVLRTMPKARFLGTQTLAFLTKKAAGLHTLSDSQCGYTAASSRALRAIDLDALWPRYGYPNDIIGALCRAGMRIEEVPVRAVYRGEASGLRPWHLLTISYLIARVAYRRIHSQSRETP